MTRVFKTILITAVTLLVSFPAFAGLSDPEGNFALFKDTKFSLKGDYEAYYKYFNDRDLNGFNGNGTAVHPVTGETYYTQTDQVEEWFEHEVRLYPKIYFNDKLEFNMRLDVARYLWQSDIAARFQTGPDDDDENMTVVYEDNEKLRVKEANLQMITPIGLFLVGRFDTDKHGLVYALQFPQLPKWSFAAAYLMKHEGKYNTEGLYYNYLETKNFDYLDRDDQNESALISIYEDGEGLKSQQWIEYRFSDSKTELAKSTAVYLPQYELNYDKNNLHLHCYVGMGFGTVAELTKMEAANDLRELVNMGNLLADTLQPNALDVPDVAPKDIEVKSSLNYTVAAAYDIDRNTPQIRLMSLDGAKSYNEVQGLLWDRYEPSGYRTPRLLKLCLFGEIEDKYFTLLSTLGTQEAFDVEDIAYTNFTGIFVNNTFRMTDKWELFTQIAGLWRTKTDYYEKNYWDMFPIMYALNNMYTDSSGDDIIPLVFKKRGVDYTPDVDPFLGMELNSVVTYHLFPGLDVSLIGAYFKAGDFYKDVLTPKEYLVQWVNRRTSAPVEGQGLISIKGPYQFDDYDLKDAWTIQLKVDFKFEI